MIVRVVVKNLFSFKEQTEFNMLPSQASRLKFHKYGRAGKDILKLTSIYGANGSGKSNFIKAIKLLKDFVILGSIPRALKEQKFRLDPASRNESVEIGIEFFVGEKLFYFSIAINDNKVIEEYLCTIDGKNNDDNVIFHRKIEDEKLVLSFYKDFEDNAENLLLKKLLIQDLIKSDKSLMFLLNSLSNPGFAEIKEAFSWLDDDLVIIFPSTKANALTLLFDDDKKLKIFANDTIRSLGTGISRFSVTTTPIREYMGDNEREEVEKMTERLIADPDVAGVIVDPSTGEEVHAVNHNGEIFAKRLLFEHNGDAGSTIGFNFLEESDGTRRLIEYVPALYDLITESKTYLIDEIERSIHPVIIRELLAKFSLDQKTKGQLIFTTHESNLLDQEILRTDEIWFAQKNKSGATKMYSLSSFKEHSTIDIRKGYLNGRYGAIPFIGNLQDLNWHSYVE